MFYTNTNTFGARVVRHLWYEIIKVECEQATADPNSSALPGAYLTLRGPVLDVELAKTAPLYPADDINRYQMVMRGGVDLIGTGSSQSIILNNPDTPLERPHVSDDPGNRIFCLKMALIDRHRTVGIETVEYAMLLRRAGDRGVYRRIGMIAHKHPFSSETGERQLRSAFSGCGDRLAIRVL